jgi:hypothetical protein
MALKIDTHLMVTDSILLVSRAERQGWDDRSRRLVWIRSDVNSSGAEAVCMGLLHIMGMCIVGIDAVHEVAVGISVGQRLKSVR